MQNFQILALQEKAQVAMEHTFRLELLALRAMLLQNTWLQVYFPLWFVVYSVHYCVEKHSFPFLTGRLTSKSDVYSFGVVLLELLSGKRAMGDESIGGAEGSLVNWAKPFLSEGRQFSRIMDTKLRGEYSKRGAQAASFLTFRCLHVDPKNRPPMVEVLAELEQLQVRRVSPRTTLKQ